MQDNIFSSLIKILLHSLDVGPMLTMKSTINTFTENVLQATNEYVYLLDPSERNYKLSFKKNILIIE